MHIAYFINQYPKVSHSFIRREILALERQGFMVSRIALRGWQDKVVDIEDIREQAKTRYVLKKGLLGLILATLACMRSPRRFFKALKYATKLSLGSDRSLPYHFIYFAEACQLVQWVNAGSVEHIHAHFGTNSAEVAMLASVLGNIPYSFTVHGPEEFDKPQALKLGAKIAKAKFVVAISQYGCSQLYRWASFNDWPKVKVVHCGLEPAFFQVPEQPIPTSPRLLCIGRLCEQKGQLLLVEAARRLKEKGVQFHLTLAGDGEMRSDIEALIDQHKLQEHISITGWISSNQVQQYLLDSQIMVLPSFAEGLPVVIMEAMALKRPVISTYVAGIPELVVPGETGWLCPAGDIDALVEAMQKALTASRQELQAMGEQGYQRVLNQHHIDKEASLLARYFRQ